MRQLSAQILKNYLLVKQAAETNNDKSVDYDALRQQASNAANTAGEIGKGVLGAGMGAGIGGITGGLTGGYGGYQLGKALATTPSENFFSPKTFGRGALGAGLGALGALGGAALGTGLGAAGGAGAGPVPPIVGAGLGGLGGAGIGALLGRYPGFKNIGNATTAARGGVLGGILGTGAGLLGGLGYGALAGGDEAPQVAPQPHPMPAYY